MPATHDESEHQPENGGQNHIFQDLLSHKESSHSMSSLSDDQAHTADIIINVTFQWKNPDFLLKNPDFLFRNPDFILKTVDCIIMKTDTPS